jgi:hypothetical protein
MSVTLTVEDAALRRALSQYAQMKNKTDAEVVNKAMRYWVPFAAKRVINKTPGGRKIKQELLGPAEGRYKAKRSKSKYNNTAAMAIFIWRLKKRGKPIPADLTEQIDRFVGARNNSAQFLRAGFIPAFKQFKVPNRKVGTQRNFKGRSQGKLATESLFFKVEAFARNAREGAAKIAPEAFRESLPEVTAIFIKFMNQDMQRIAKSTGFA